MLGHGVANGDSTARPPRLTIRCGSAACTRGVGPSPLVAHIRRAVASSICPSGSGASTPADYGPLNPSGESRARPPTPPYRRGTAPITSSAGEFNTALYPACSDIEALLGALAVATADHTSAQRHPPMPGWRLRPAHRLDLARARPVECGRAMTELCRGEQTALAPARCMGQTCDGGRGRISPRRRVSAGRVPSRSQGVPP